MDLKELSEKKRILDKNCPLPKNDADHPVKRAAEAHYRLAAIHPFVDGNGRTAKAFDEFTFA